MSEEAKRAAERCAGKRKQADAALEEDWCWHVEQLEESEERWQALRARPAAIHAPPPPPSEPKVFNLTGMSAAEVGGMVSAVSQATIGALEHDDAAWEVYDRCRRQ